MRKFAILTVLCSAACTAVPVRPAPSQPAPRQAWTARDVARFHARCAAGFDLPSEELTALFCDRLGDHMREAFSAEWLTDGQPPSTREKHQVDHFVDECVDALALSAL